MKRWPSLGLIALVVAAGGLLTGPFLAFNYAPTLDAAYDSVSHIENEVSLGWLLRSLHHWAANFAIVLAALHGLRLFWTGAYKRPRHFAWVIGCLVFLVLVGFGYTGYLLAGDERAQTGLTVMEQVAGSTPLVGEQASAVLKGGATVSSATLTRVHAIHTMILPALLVVLLVAFYLAVRKAAPQTLPWSAQLARDAKLAVAVCVALALFAFLFRPGLGARPGEGAQDARPEWFFLWVNLLLRWVPGAKFAIGGLLPGLLAGLALGLPWVARGRQTAPARRKPELAVAAAILACLGALTVVSVASAPHSEEHDHSEAAPPEQGASIEERADPILRRFKCRSCHTIDGDEEGGETGPALDREGFGTLYTRKLFRLKVRDPVAFFPETAMRYSPPKRKPNDEQVELLVEYFFGK